MTKSKDHKVCSQCQQVRPLSDNRAAFNELKRLHGELSYMEARSNPYFDDAVWLCVRNLAKILEPETHNNDKSSRNQVLDEAKEAYKAERFKSKTHVNAQDETSRVINAIEGLKQ